MFTFIIPEAVLSQPRRPHNQHLYPHPTKFAQRELPRAHRRSVTVERDPWGLWCHNYRQDLPMIV